MKLPWSYFILRNSGKVRCEPGWSLGPDWATHLNDCDLWYVWAGNGHMQLEDREIPLKPGTCLWMRPGRRYLAKHDPKDPLGVSFIHFTPVRNSGETCLAHEELPDEVQQVEDPLFFSAVMTRIVHHLRGYNLHHIRPSPPASYPSVPGPAHWLFQSLIHELITADARSGASHIPLHRHQIEEQIAHIYEQPGRAPPVRKLAREAGLSIDHYGRLFRRLAGISPRELVQQARLERACQLLRETPLTISEVAEQAGYADVYQFSRLFKKRMGKAPSTWRKFLNAAISPPQPAPVAPGPGCAD